MYVSEFVYICVCVCVLVYACECKCECMWGVITTHILILLCDHSLYSYLYRYTTMPIMGLRHICLQYYIIVLAHVYNVLSS